MGYRGQREHLHPEKPKQTTYIYFCIWDIKPIGFSWLARKWTKLWQREAAGEKCIVHQLVGFQQKRSVPTPTRTWENRFCLVNVPFFSQQWEFFFFTWQQCLGSSEPAGQLNNMITGVRKTCFQTSFCWQKWSHWFWGIRGGFTNLSQQVHWKLPQRR